MRGYVVAGLCALLVAIIGTSLAVSSWQSGNDHDRDTATYRQDIDTWHQRLDGCSRSKTDRTATAAALRAQATYLNLVLDAASVKADVKRAARVAQGTFNASATDLESRTGRALVCSEVYPKPPVPDGVTPLP